jgi:hypothetical protein
MLLYQKPGQYIGGHAIGILVLQIDYPVFPGTIANALTFDYPVRFGVIKTDIHPTKIFNGDKQFIEPILKAGNELVTDGVRAIVGACGYFGFLQKDLADMFDVPTFMSSLLQIPLIVASLKNSQKLGIVCANKTAFSDNLLKNLDLLSYKNRLIIEGIEDQEEFATNMIGMTGVLNLKKYGDEVVYKARYLVENNDNVGAILLECSDFPAFAKQVSIATKLPVFDFVTLINWIYGSIVKKEYEGFI